MAYNLTSFVKQKDYLVCVDSDGCAMDTMDVKHFNCVFTHFDCPSCFT